MKSLLQILTLSSLILHSVKSGTSITSKNCNAEIYFDEINIVSSKNIKNPTKVNLISSPDSDPCESKTSSDQSKTTLTFNLPTSNNTNLIFKVVTSQNRFSMDEVVLDNKSYKP